MGSRTDRSSAARRKTAWSGSRASIPASRLTATGSAGTSGKTTRRTSAKAATTEAAPGPPSRSISSWKTRSRATLASRTACFASAAAVRGSIWNVRTDAKRSARRMRRASSSNRCSGWPTQRTRRWRRSAWPPNGSMTSAGSNRADTWPRGQTQAMALIVKSRRDKSAVIWFVKWTVSGRRRSV